MNPPRFDALGRQSTTAQRISVTVSPDLYSRLAGIAIKQGRSVSNLCAYLLERSCENHPMANTLQP